MTHSYYYARVSGMLGALKRTCKRRTPSFPGAGSSQAQVCEDGKVRGSCGTCREGIASFNRSLHWTIDYSPSRRNHELIPCRSRSHQGSPYRFRCSSCTKRLRRRCVGQDQALSGPPSPSTHPPRPLFSMIRPATCHCNPQDDIC